MKALHRVLPAILAVLVLVGCAAAPAEETAAPTSRTEMDPVQPAPQETEPAVQTLDFPQEDAATGLLKFYFGEREIYAGGSVADILELGIYSYSDFSEVIRPGHISDIIRVEVPAENDGEGSVFFFRAINPSAEDLTIGECSIYSITVNGEEGIRFGSGREESPFVNRQTTEEMLIETYGAPDFSQSLDESYREIAYYEPFSCAYFTFEEGVLRQIMTHYSANLHTDLIASFDQELSGYFGNDAWILMSQYMDVAPYLAGEQLPQGTGVLDAVEETILLAGEQIRLGCYVYDLPERFAEPYKEVEMNLGSFYYVRIGIGNPEEFYLINRYGLRDSKAYYAEVKGIFTSNLGYTNWGNDFGDYQEFEYAGLKSGSTIGEVLSIFGNPAQIQCSSNANCGFVWMHYYDEAGNELRICVDPLVDQIVELRVSKYFEKERSY